MSAVIDTQAQEWAGILDKDETILWQGRPDGQFVWERRMLSTTLFGCFFAGFAILWMAGVAVAGGDFWGFGLLFVAVGLWLIAHTLLQPSFVRRRTWYTLTNKQAYIATELPIIGRRLTSYKLDKGIRIEGADTDLPSVIFASKTVENDNGTQHVPIGFERIKAADMVANLMQGLQKDNK